MLRFRFLLLQMAFSIAGFSQQLFVENYSPANGLLDTRITRIFQDHRGLLYFLTWEGISIYDGQSFENISEYNGESLGLVNEIIQWKGDTCIVFTFRKGAFKLIHNRLIRDSSLNQIDEPTRVIPAGNGEWIIITNTGIFRWNGDQTRALLTVPDKRPIRGVENALLLNGYLLFFKQEEKILQLLELSSGNIKSSLPANKATAITASNRESIFARLDGRWMQLNKDALASGLLVPEPFPFTQYIPAGFQVHQLYSTGEKVWMQDFQKGFLLLDTKTGTVESYPATEQIDGHANIIAADRENNFWISSFNKKLQKAFYTKLQRINQPGVTSLQTDESGKTIAIAGKQAFWIENGKLQAATTVGKNPVALVWQNKSWYFTSPSRLQSQSGEVLDLQLPGITTNSFYYSNRFQVDAAGRLILCGNTLFIAEENLKVRSRQLPYFTDNLVIDQNNLLTAFSRGGEIRTYRIAGDSIQEGNHVYWLKNLDPRCAIHWNKDTFCIGTRFQGIVWLKITDGVIKETGRISTSRGLSNNFVIALAKKNQELYAGTGTGFDLISISGTDSTVQNLAAANNLYASFNWVVSNQKGQVYALSADGQLWQVADRPKPLPASPAFVWWKGIEVNGKERAMTGNSFPYQQNNFRFVVTAPCFSNAANLRFQFKLSGGKKEWEQISSNNYFNISNLSPGHYQIQVTVLYPGKIYPDKTIYWTFTIESPFWKRGWFIILSLFLAAAIIWSIARSYYRKKLAIQQSEAEKKQAVEKERNRISRDMHDDLGSGLTKIAILSEVAKKQLNEPDKARDQLEKISGSSRELVDNLQDIIWVLNPANDSMENLAAYLREYTLKFFEPLALETRFHYPEQFLERHLTEEKRRNLFLTVKESLHNIAKYAGCHIVEISILEEPDACLIIIKDDGNGFEISQVRPFANGLKNMETRISQSGGKYEIESAPGKGTCTRIRMPV